MDRRTFLKGALASGAAVGAASSLPPASGAEIVLPYTADSFFKSQAIGLPIDEARTQAFKTFMKTHPDQKNTAYPKFTGQNGNQWGTTFHLGVPEDPVWKVSTGFRKETKILATQGFHMADEVVDRVPTGTQDRPMLVVDVANGYSVFFADVVPNRANRTVAVSASAITYHSSNGLDKRNPRTNDPRNFTSRGRLSDACIVRPDVLKQAIAGGTSLGHVLQFFFVETKTADGFCHPMVGAESGKYGFGAEGERVAIRSDIDLSARGLTDAALVIAKTLQEHGAYIGDNSGSGTQMKGAQTTSSFNPYEGTNFGQNCLQGKVTWDDFVVIQRGVQ